ncbi:sel1 repeat family protein [Terrarubrum flagellatum]|uniref:sel1 repeat family protein n=1 Tax=Terrirubrum flagellatum TaxID=2895980 RepID=UPI003144F2C8
MGRFEFRSEQLETAATPAETYLALGMASISGRDGEPDRVEAHKWFNIAAIRGCREAAARRGEVAIEMSAEEIAQAQRAARQWLTLH